MLLCKGSPFNDLLTENQKKRHRPRAGIIETFLRVARSHPSVGNSRRWSVLYHKAGVGCNLVLLDIGTEMSGTANWEEDKDGRGDHQKTMELGELL